MLIMLLRPQGLFGTSELWDLSFFKLKGPARASSRVGEKGAP